MGLRIGIERDRHNLLRTARIRRSNGMRMTIVAQQDKTAVVLVPKTELADCQVSNSVVGYVAAHKSRGLDVWFECVTPAPAFHGACDKNCVITYVAPANDCMASPSGERYDESRSLRLPDMVRFRVRRQDEVARYF